MKQFDQFNHGFSEGTGSLVFFLASCHLEEVDSVFFCSRNLNCAIEAMTKVFSLYFQQGCIPYLKDYTLVLPSKNLCLLIERSKRVLL
jgi:hypothetical protein